MVLPNIIESKPSNFRILLVDDDDIALFLHNTVLKDAGANVPIKSFNSGKGALQYLDDEQHNQIKYLVFLDINMPIMNGWQFLEALEQHAVAKQTKVIMVTSSVAPAERLRALSIPIVEHFLTKPLREEALENLKSLPEIAPFFKD